MARLGFALAACVLMTTTSGCLAADAVVRNFGAGTDANSVGIIPPGEDSDTDGPQAIYASESGDVYLLDQLNNRVLKIDPRDPTREPQSLELPDDVQASDIVVSNDTIYAWDGQVRALQPTGAPDAPTRGLTMTRSTGAVDETVTNAFEQMGTQSTEDEPTTRSIGKQATAVGRGRQTVATYGNGTVVASLTPFAQDAGVQIALQAKGATKAMATIKLQVRSKLGTVELLNIDKEGRAFVLAENIPTDYSDQAAIFVARYAKAGALEGVYELPFTSSIAISRRFVTVSPEGDVYFLRNRKEGTDVLGVGFRPMKNATVISLAPAAAQPTMAMLARQKGANAAVRPLTRAQVIETANAFASIRWRVNPSAYGPTPDTACTGFNRVRRPGYLNGKVNQEVQGIPYCWGCMGSLPQIATLIDRGMKAGNVCTRNDPRRDVAGVDCSAFVSAAWGLQTHFTTIAIPSIAKPLPNPLGLLPGDALNKAGSHVMLFVRFTPDKKAEVIEASTGGCNGKVCHNVYPLGSLLARGYVPVRYRGLVNDLSAPTEVAAKASADKPAPKATEATQAHKSGHKGRR
jgi:hypothetical protein